MYVYIYVYILYWLTVSIHYECFTVACGRHGFICSNGRCISRYQRCDGINQCGDFSDEVSCCMSILFV